MVVLTVNSDATHVDGYVERDGVDEAWATIRAGAGNGSSYAATAAGVKITCSATSNQFATIRRGIYLFNTSILTAQSTIISAVFSIYVTSRVVTLASQSLSLVDSSPAADNALANGDYANVGGATPTKYASDMTLASMTDDAYNDFTLNAAGLAAISKTGTTKLGLRITKDADNSAPTWGSGNEASVVHTLAPAGSNKPKLVITYSLPSAGFFHFL